MELLHKLTAVLLCDTCKLHCIKYNGHRESPSTCAALSGQLLPRLGQRTHSTDLFPLGKPHPLQDGSAFASSISADVFPEEDSEPLTSCKETEGGTLLN